MKPLTAPKNPRMSAALIDVLIWMDTQDVRNGAPVYHRVHARRTYGLAGREVILNHALAFIRRDLVEEHPDNHYADKYGGMSMRIRLNAAGTELAARLAVEKILAAGDALYDEAAAIDATR